MEPMLVELDGRRRASLARVGAEHRYYLAHRDPDGTIVLTPAVVQSELEARLHQSNPDLAGRIRAQAAAPDRRLVSTPRGRRRAKKS